MLLQLHLTEDHVIFTLSEGLRSKVPLSLTQALYELEKRLLPVDPFNRVSPGYTSIDE